VRCLVIFSRRRTALGLTLRCDRLSRESIAGLLERARRSVASAAPRDLVDAAAAYLGAVEPLETALAEHDADNALHEQSAALRTEFVASAAASVVRAAPPSTYPTRRRVRSEGPLVRPANTRPLGAVPRHGGALGAAGPSQGARGDARASDSLRETLSPALREELTTLDAQFTYITGEPALAGVAILGHPLP
jgi:hypothetical protein